MPKQSADAIPNELLIHARRQKELLQIDLAGQLDPVPDKRTVSRWEQGNTKPYPHYRTQLAKIFKRSTSQLGYPKKGEIPFEKIDYKRNTLFTAREDILLQLATVPILRKQRNKEKQAEEEPGEEQDDVPATYMPQILSGLGGVGKTQIAVEYAYRYQYEYHTIILLNANTPVTLASEFANIAQILGIPERHSTNQNEIIAAVKAWFSSPYLTRWLLIFDNVDSPETLHEVINLLPTKYYGHIILTTRMEEVGTQVKKIEVNPLSLKESASLLLRRAGLVERDASLHEASHEDRENALLLTREFFDGLPLALDQAGAFIKETKKDLAGYITLYEKQRSDLLQYRGKHGREYHYPASVATTWSLSFEAIRQANPIASELIAFLAFLAPDAIPEEMITGSALKLGPILYVLEENPLAFDLAIKELLTYSLVQRHSQTKTCSIHRLVQAVLQDTMDERTRRQWAERSVLAVNTIFPEGDFTETRRCQRYLPHALVCADMIKQWSILSPEAGRLLTLAGAFLREMALYDQAERLLQQSLEIRRKVFGSQHSDIAQSLDHLAVLAFKLGDYAQAERPEKEALEMYKKTLGRENPATIECLNTLAVIYDYQANYIEAEPLFQQALTLREKVLGPEHLDTAITLGTFGSCYVDQGKYEQAEPLLQRALAIHERESGPNHYDTATCLNNLFRLYFKQGDYPQAEPLIRRALTIYEEKRGPNHPDTATALNNLAYLYNAQNLFDLAEPLYERVLAIDEKVNGSDHPDTATSLHNLANVYRNQRKYEQAELLMRRALTIRERTLEPDHPHMGISCHDLGVLYTDQGKYEQAEPFFQRALEIRESKHEPEHPDT